MATASPPSKSTAHRATPFILATILIDAIGFGIVLPVLPDLVRTIGHVGLADATRIGGWLGVAYAGMQVLCGPLVGNLGDRFGRRPVILASLAALGIDYLLMAWAPTLAWLFAGRLVAGLCGASWGPASAALADISPPEDRARRFGYVGAAFGIGFIAGPVLGGLLGEIGPRAPFIAAAALAVLNFGYGLLLFPETLPQDRRRAFDWRRANPLGALATARRIGGLAPLALVYFFWSLGSMVYPATWAFYAVLRFGWSPGMIGASLAWTGICMAVVQSTLTGRIVARFGEPASAIGGMAITTLLFVAYAFVPSAWMLFPLLTIGALPGVVQPAVTSMLSTRVPADMQGELQGINGSIAALAALLAPFVLNLPLAWFTRDDAPVRLTGAAFLVAAAAVLVAMLLLVGWRRRAAAA